MGGPVILAALNARYSHSSLGVRFLLANSPVALQARSRLMEFSINEPPAEIVASLLAENPAVIGLGVYIWNRSLVEDVVCRLRAAQPELKLVLGGPEISYDANSALGRSVDCVICGEGERLWPEVCVALLDQRSVPRVPQPQAPDVARLKLPDRLYREHDVHNRIVYVEASRGCPLACDFCLSSVQSGIRHFPSAAVKASMQRLLARGCRRFRFIDRSFNLGGASAHDLLAFLRDRLPPDGCVHLEMTPDGLSPSLRELLKAFPPGCLHIEAGIQSFTSAVLQTVNRHGDVARAEEGLRWLATESGAVVHADLIAGLPGETPEGFVAGFDRLYRLGPQEIQVGILKCLHGTALKRHAHAYGMRYRPTPPYDVLCTSTMSTAVLEDIRRFAAHWERVVNRRHFPRTVKVMLGAAASPWQRFDAFSRRLAARHGVTGIGLVEMADCLFTFLCDNVGMADATARGFVREDYLDGNRRMHLPAMLKK